jgi:hypothetical protein
MLWEQTENKSLTLMGPKPLPGTNVSVPYVSAGDKATSLQANLLLPYAARNLVTRKKIFTFCHSRARNYAVRISGILTNK